MLKTLIIALLTSLSTLAAWQNGDIILQQTPGHQAKAVQLATNSPWTHVGVVFLTKDGPQVLEAVQPVQIVPVKKFIKRSYKGKYQVMRLKNNTSMTLNSLNKADKWAKAQIGKNYDGRFQWSDQTLYCSELVWKIFKVAGNIELCPIKKVGDYNLKNPTVKALIKQRFGSITRLNLNEPIVAPSDIAASTLLTIVDPAK